MNTHYWDEEDIESEVRHRIESDILADIEDRLELETLSLREQYDGIELQSALENAREEIEREVRDDWEGTIQDAIREELQSHDDD